MNTRKVALALRAAIKVTAPAPANGKRKRVTARFIHDSELAASRTPLCPVRRDSPPARPELRQKMSQLVAQGAIDFCDAVFVQPRV